MKHTSERGPTTSAMIDAGLWAMSAIAAASTGWLSLVSVPPGTSAFAYADKVEHFVAYFVTSGLLYLAAVWRPGRGDGRFAGAGLAIVPAFALFAGVIEVLQGIVGRESEVLDWIAGSLGAAAAISLLGHLRRTA